MREYLGAHCGHLLGADGLPVLRPLPAWNGLLVEYREIPMAATCGPQFAGMPVLAFVLAGRGTQWHRSGRVRTEIRTAPSLANCFGRDYERDFGHWAGDQGCSITVRMPESALERLLREEACRFDLDTRYELQDPVLERILRSLAEEVQGGLPNGLIYADGLCLSLLGWLASHHARRRPSVSHARRLSPAEQGSVRDYIEANLQSALTIDVLASLVGLSPSQFSRLFSASFGMPPHRYVLERRVARAASLLRSRAPKPMADIARTCGFSSHAHLSVAFKRVVHQTPAQFRNESS